MLKKLNRSAKEAASNPPRSTSATETSIKHRVEPLAKSQQTTIGEGITIDGNIRGDENLVVDGNMKGSIELPAHQFTVGPRGKVEAEILAENVTISGKLVGNIQASGKVEITKEANFTGEIRAKRIAVEDGAYLKAVIELEQDSQKPLSSVKIDPKPDYDPELRNTGNVSKG